MSTQSTKATNSSNYQQNSYFQNDDHCQYAEVCLNIYQVELNIPQIIKNNYHYDIEMHLFTQNCCIYNYIKSILANENLIAQLDIGNNKISIDFSKREELCELSEYFEQTLVQGNDQHTFFKVNIREQELETL